MAFPIDFFMINKGKKQEIIKDLTDKLSRQKAVIFTDYTGLKVSQVENLRKKLRKENAEYQTAKKTLIDLALGKAGFKDVKVKNLKGQISVSFSYSDEMVLAKMLYQFSKENDGLKILAGIINGEYFESEAIKNLARLPSRQELLSKLVWTIAAPMSGLVNLLKANLRNFVYLLKNINLETRNS